MNKAFIKPVAFIKIIALIAAHMMQSEIGSEWKQSLAHNR